MSPSHLVMMPASLIRFLYTQNPFYLIGTFVILFGLQQCLGEEPQLAASGMLSSILPAWACGQTLVIISNPRLAIVSRFIPWVPESR